ncbi:putative RNA-directed DNA polymerase from transposon X-element [Araneus ventricosus]|uniref:Putative RNA-directed DNA polymerase from transposon X-element n=1 Tax=Araneus ventricosus TaxID=182803 RepID=A0A4Y2WHG6_ARAVE|nr:putative RNA-directed DNA polymerase from transposon X-element [Araneus ventricosus]
MLKFHYFPNEWKTAIVIPILKPGKHAKDPGSYRPISLLSALSKVAESVLLKRIVEATEGKLIPMQFGFRKNLSTVQQLLRITEIVKEGMDEGWDTGAVFLDIAEAFDRVWTDGLLYKLIMMRIPGGIVRLMATYLRGRCFAVRVGSDLFSERAIDAGVAQGSKIGPVLFNIYVNDIPCPRNCQTRLCLFADDTAVMSTGESNKVIEELSVYLEQLGKWLIMWKIKVNTDKCQTVCFTRRRKVPDPRKLYRKAINWSKETKYLGVTLDSRLTYEKHITNINKKARSAKAKIYPLIGKNSKLSLKNKLLLYKTILGPIMSYVSPVWGAAAKSHIQKLESIQNIIARQITNAHWYILNRYILKDLRLTTIISHIKKLAVNFFHKIDNHTNEAVKEIPNYDPINPKKKRRPRTLLLPCN